VMNIGLLYSMMEQWDSAAVWYERYRTDVDPDNPAALTRLAEAFQRAGDTTQAMALYDSVIVRAPTMGASDLFKTGEALFLAERYDIASKAFALGLEKNKFYRPALYNLANCYLAVAQESEGAAADSAASKMEAAAQLLVEVDPASVEALELLAASYQLQGRNDETLALLEKREAMTFDVALDNQQKVDGGYVVQGRVVNSTDHEVTTPPLVFEFIDGPGNVLETQTYESQTLSSGSAESFVLTASNDDVMAVRYHVEGGDQ
jgi:tetratricopeptide (TPR) repeat protein